MFKGPDDLHGHSHHYVRLYWTGVGFQANIVEEEVLLSALSHIFAGLRRTWDHKPSTGLMGGQLTLAISDLKLLTFMTISSISATLDHISCALHQPSSIG